MCGVWIKDNNKSNNSNESDQLEENKNERHFNLGGNGDDLQVIKSRKFPKMERLNLKKKLNSPQPLDDSSEIEEVKIVMDDDNLTDTGSGKPIYSSIQSDFRRKPC